MITRKHVPFLAVSFCLATLAPHLDAQGNEPCPPPAVCGPCPSDSVTHEVRYNPGTIPPGTHLIQVPRFDPSKGTLVKVFVRTEIEPHEMTYRLQNLETFACSTSIPPQEYCVRGAIDVRDPFGGFLAVTSDKCLGWEVSGTLPAQLSAQPAEPYNCIDFNEDDDVFSGNCPPGHGGPCISLLPPDPNCAPCGAPGPNLSPGPSGLRRRCGSGVDGTPKPGYSDRRRFAAGFPNVPASNGDIYSSEACFVLPDQVAVFVATGGSTGCMLDLETNMLLQRIFPPAFQGCGNVLQQAIVRIGVRLTIEYVYCPYPPDALDDSVELCRVVGAAANVNVLANDTLGIGDSVCPSGEACTGLDCAYLTGENGIVQGLYGTAQWVTDAACVNGLCPLPSPPGMPNCDQQPRCIRYTLTQIPPPGVRLDQFSYTIRTPTGCLDVATVDVNISSPTALPDLADVCRELGSWDVVNVLANDTSGNRRLDCGYLVDDNGIGQGQYGFAEWVSDAECATELLCENGQAPARCIRYRLLTLPPPDVRLDSFTYTIRDTLDCESTATVQVRISSPNAAPDVADLCRELGSVRVINVLANDTSGNRRLDCEYLAGTEGILQGRYGWAEWVSDPSCVNAVVCENGSVSTKCLSYTLTTLPPAGVRVDTFTYTIRDEARCSSSAEVRVNISSPTAAPDTVEVCRALNESSLVNVLLNDTSGNRRLACDQLVGKNGIDQGLYGDAEWVSGACVNSLLCADGQPAARCIRYTLRVLPPANVRLDTFTYTIYDELNCPSQASVRVEISSPTALRDVVEVCRAVGSSQLANVLANDSSGNRPLDCDFLSGSNGVMQGVYGFASWEIDPTCVSMLACADGQPVTKCLRYTLTQLPPEGTRTDTVTYTIQDTLGCTARAVLQVRISAPTALSDSGDVCRELGSSTIIPVLENDTNGNRRLNCGELTGDFGIVQGMYGVAEWITDPGCASSIACMNEQPATLCIRYTLTSLPPTAVRLDTFRYTIRDANDCSAEGTVEVSISSPTCTPDTALVCGTPSSTTLVNVLLNDLNGNRPLDCNYLTGTNGLTNGAYGTVTWVTNSGQANGLCDQRSIRYTLNTAPPNGVFTDTFSYTIRDTAGCTSVCQVTVTICVIDVPPVTAEVCPSETVPICILDGATSNCGVLGCDSLQILGPGPLLGSAVPCSAPGACVSEAACGGMTSCTSGCILYAAGGNSCGTDQFTVRVRVGECFVDVPVSVRIKPRPDAVDDLLEVQFVTPGQVFEVPVLANDRPCVACDDPCAATCDFQGLPTLVSQPAPSVGTAEVLANGSIRFTAGPAFDGNARICYQICNTCGCVDEACLILSECLVVNRRKPGSLLLWPEYDNRDPVRTLLTITNTFCLPSGPSIQVEIVYIDKDSCLETNFTISLTPCDTLTLYTSAQAPISSRGFVYAFAKDAQGRAVSYNHLIGTAIQLDPVSGDSYGFNAVSLCSPLREGLLTDLDMDGIRDLDMYEYMPLPDEVLVPRFLGQDPLGPLSIYHSDLILLGLSGGASFDTTVQMLIYNDSEDVVSQNVTFRCWEKKKLMEWSGAFGNAFLMNLGDDPDEILGAPDRVAGWIRLNGLVATSRLEVIQDPAIYALLVERTSSSVVADLPWELCSQNNGDLWPIGPLGDGPNPVAGDNQ